jgi:hypothetical protein
MCRLPAGVANRRALVWHGWPAAGSIRRPAAPAQDQRPASLRRRPGRAGADSPIFDVVFLNERGEVAEGARSNVFVDREVSC